MRLCTCGHRDARHDQLIGQCHACLCGVFEDAKSLIEAEVYRPESVGPIVHIEAPEPPASELPVAASLAPPGEVIELAETPAVRRFVNAYVETVGPIPVATDQEIAEHLAGGNDIVKFTRVPNVSVAQTMRVPVAELLESFDAWRCTVCGSRSASNQRCNVRVSCRNRWREPVRVEIRSREVP